MNKLWSLADGLNFGKINKVTEIPDTSPLSEQEKQLLKENQELKEANKILKDALGFL